MKIKSILFLSLSLVFLSDSLLAQNPSFLNRSLDWKETIVYQSIDAPDSETIRAIEENPYNHAMSIKMDVAPVNVPEQSYKTVETGSTFFYFGYEVKSASALAIRMRDIALPRGASLYFINPKSNEFIGPYSSDDLNSSGALFSGFLKGDRILMELVCPNEAMNDLSMSIIALDYGFNEGIITEGSALLGFGDALDCEVNVNCPENVIWQNTRKSVCRITVVTDQGAYWCSGTLVNNTNEDKHPYILTAKHCYFNDIPEYDLWRFDFAYESDACSNPDVAPAFNSIFGASFVSERQESDFLLLELSSMVPDAFDVVYAGWNREGVVADTSALIGHPVGDIKKISIDYDVAEIFTDDLDFSIFVIPADHLYELEFDLGIFEPGSSGGPMLDQSSRVVGQLTGGFADDCNSLITYYGRFSRSWADGAVPSARLSDWLDPTGQNPLFLDELDPGQGVLEISGQIDYNGQPVVGVDVMISGEIIETISSDISGNYLFTDLLDAGDYSISFSKNNLLLNGVTTLDAVFIQKHILGINPIVDPYKLIAGDLNASGSVSTLDIVHLQKAILGLSDSFPNNESWRFVPADFIFTDPANPFLDDWPEIFEYTNLNTSQTGQDVKAIKIGDMNGNANPAL